MACLSVEGASSLSEVRVIGLYQYISVSSFPQRTMSQMYPMLRALKHLPRFDVSVDGSNKPHSSAKVSSANFACTEFYEVRSKGRATAGSPTRAAERRLSGPRDGALLSRCSPRVEG